MIRWLAVIGLASPASAAPAPVDHADVDTGSLVREPDAAIELASVADATWRWGLPPQTGTITWHARWLHDPLKPSLLVIELTSPDLAAALRAF